jgi:hypothetical protein
LELQAAETAAGHQGEPAGSSLAVNNTTHDIYVADTGNRRIDEFDPSKPPAEQFVGAFGKEVGPLGEDTCTTLSTCKAGAPGSEPGEFESPTFVTVDNDPGSASFGDVYVGDQGDNLVSKFTSEGVLVASWGNNGPGGAANGQLDIGTVAGNPTLPLGGIAVDGFGDLWVRGTERLYEFPQAGPPQTGECNTELGGHPGQIGVNSANDLYVVAGPPIGPVDEFSPTCTRLGGGFGPKEYRLNYWCGVIV